MRDGSSNAKPLNLDRILGDPKNRIARMSVELEGGWSKVPPDVTIDRDGSVFGDAPPQGYRAGEIQIGPMEPGAIARSMKKYYPQLVDATCGMHIHMSFKTTRHYGWLMEPEFQETVIEYLTRWAKKEGFPPNHHIWERLSGKSRYCQKKYWPEEQLAVKAKDHNQQRHGHRYTIVHYCGRLNTIEIRVLPMMDTVEQAIRAVDFIVDITNASLLKLSEKENKSKINGKIELGNGWVCEEFETEIPLTASQRRRLRE